MLLILVCFVSFRLLSQHLFRLFLYCLSEISLFVCKAIFRFRRLSLILKKSSCFTENFYFYLILEVENLLLHIINNDHYLTQCFCKL